MTAPTILVLPGLGDSGPEHWQSRWENEWPTFVRVRQRSWDQPELSEWLAALEAAVSAAPTPTILLAHSLSCSLVVQFAARYGNPGACIRGALLVAPADVDSCEHTPPETRSFAPLPLLPLPFPSTVVASRNDPYVAFSRARELAGAWGAEFVDAGDIGHINAASGLGQWPDGKRCLDRLLERTSG
ncbi:MAG TPA: alpha/beta hydrolase [Polyangiaceae bacterium]|nr:alpha/beta hydrolase [Polyangiaceae bacterium]